MKALPNVPANSDINFDDEMFTFVVQRGETNGAEALPLSRTS